jgi:hypothetical protein
VKLNLIANRIEKISRAEGFCCLDVSFGSLRNDLACSFIPNTKVTAFLPGLLLLWVPKIFGFVSVGPPVDLLLDGVSHS